jgi:SpoIID/LytB domain protein
MSQVGAIAMAQSGSTYQEILEHYYPGSKLQLDPSPPSYVTFANEDYGLVDYLARTTEMEIGRGTTAEAFKAQVVAAYTYAKARSFKGLNTTVQAFSYKTPAELSLRYVREVLGMDDMHEKPRPPVLTVNNKPALAPYFASCAGKTTDVTSVWGGSLATYPHLAGGVTSPGKVSIVEVTFTLEQFRSFIRAYNEAYPGSAISLGSDPKQWVKILSHDSAYSSGIGYAKQVQVGDRVVSGNTFRIYVLGGAIRSHCFTISVS